MRRTQRHYRYVVSRALRTLHQDLNVAVLAAVLTSMTAPILRAADNWVDGSDNWSVLGNWSAGLPGSDVDVNIVDSDGVSRTVNYDYTGPAVSLGHLTIALTGGTGGATNTLLIQGNDLTADEDEVGVSGNGTVIQIAGNNTINTEIDVGANSGSTGVYNLSGMGTLTGTGHLVVGSIGGTGTFNQSGGTVSFTDTSNGVTLVLGSGLPTSANTSGTYNLSGGSLTSATENVGSFQGSGTFIQTGGTNTLTEPNNVAEALSVGNGQGTTGIYMLSGIGTLTSPSESINSTGTFTQNGGTNSIIGVGIHAAVLSISSGTGTNGAYNLNGGNLSADFLNENGNFTQTGGYATFSSIAEGFGNITITGGTMKLLSNGFDLPQSANYGNLSISGAGVLQMELGGYSQGVNYDSLVTYGTVSLGGTLDIDLANGFVPVVGDQFTIMSVNNTGSIAGTFDHLTSDDPGLTYSVNYGASNMVQLTITAVPEPAALPGLLACSLFHFRRRNASPSKRH